MSYCWLTYVSFLLYIWWYRMLLMKFFYLYLANTVQEWRSLIQNAVTNLIVTMHIPSSSQIAHRSQRNTRWHKDLFSPIQTEVDVLRERLQQTECDLAASQTKSTTYRGSVMERDHRSSLWSHLQSVSWYTPMGPPPWPNQEGASSHHPPATNPRRWYWCIDVYMKTLMDMLF